MKKAKDNFSKQAAFYKKFRPIYPQALYDEIYSHLTNNSVCWDCATGNGQVAIALSDRFDTVYATDISKAQLQYAQEKDNIHYSLARAEKTNFEKDKFDLITVGQAAHWLDMEAFEQEVRRVAKNKAIIAIWGYGLLRIDPAIDEYLDEFYYQTVGPYWDPQRKHIDKAYETLRFEFELLSHRIDLSIKTHWSLEQLKGYLNSWSSVQHYRRSTADINPVDPFVDRINSLWDRELIKSVEFPLFLKVGRIHKP